MYFNIHYYQKHISHFTTQKSLQPSKYTAYQIPFQKQQNYFKDKIFLSVKTYYNHTYMKQHFYHFRMKKFCNQVVMKVLGWCKWNVQKRTITLGQLLSVWQGSMDDPWTKTKVLWLGLKSHPQHDEPRSRCLSWTVFPDRVIQASNR